MAPFPMILRIALMMADLVVLLLGTVVALGILWIPLICEEPDKFTVLDNAFDQDP
jgi:hypothetical protein